MTRAALNNKYFEWMCSLVCDTKTRRMLYRKLLIRLHDISFQVVVCMDENRAEDGIDLRYRFGEECDFPDAMIATYLDDRPCSVLEMMVALVVRFEEHIMDDPDIGNRTGKWFWAMIKNLGLDDMSDDYFDPNQVDNSINRLLNREYCSDGTGGLFRIPDCRYDLRTVEIWYQMSWYLNRIIQK